MRKTFIALAASAALLASIGLPKAQMAPARAGEGDCAFTHSNAAEMTIRHFIGKDAYRSWNSKHGHSDAAEMVGQNPKWKAWERDRLVCPPGACYCRERS
jgi:hypothetical protein